MSNDQEQGLRIFDNALWRIAHRGDCEYEDAERPRPCDCPPCLAKAAIEDGKNWRFHGAFYERVRYQPDGWPREVKMHAAWVKHLTVGRDDPDRRLSQILKDDRLPSARDWYVATSVVQWLATNVGMTVLEGAGFSYRQHDQDRADAKLFESRQDREDNDTKPRGVEP